MAFGHGGFKRERGGDADVRKDAAEGKAPPALKAKLWLNTAGNKPLAWKQLKGKVVLVDLWTYWCKPCKDAIPQLNELQVKYKEDGLVVLGIHSDPDSTKGAAAVKREAINYPVAFDGGAFFKAVGCDSYPDYVLIDRKGIVRVVDLLNAETARAVEVLLKEEG
jgi:thiol-disulfide isomerase/thioredoxin